MAENSKFKLKTSEILALALVVVLFILAAWLGNEYGEEISRIIERYGKIPGMLFYFGITAVAVFIAPFSTFPLIPLAVSVWGPILAAGLTIAGWTVGSSLVFFVVRRYTYSFTRKYERVTRIQDLVSGMSEKKIFWNMVLLRALLPVDILSYALAVFTKVRFKPYFWSTIIGITPFAFVFVYVAVLPVTYQIVAAIVGMLALYTGLKKTGHFSK